ncbi:ExeM/NucH family extracellular endonuclease [Stenotrophomonas ginsengisoli]
MSLRIGLLTLACLTALPLQARPVITLIGAVQGEGATSPLAGQTVTVEGRLTADLRQGLDGFYLHGREDGNPLTSEGLLVLADEDQPLPAAACLRVRGEVVEQAAGRSGQSMTALKADTIQAASCRGLPVAGPLLLDAAPADWETLEGRLVRINVPLSVVGLHNLERSGEIWAAFGGPLWQPSEVALPGSEQARAVEQDNQRRLLVLDDADDARDPDTLALLPAGQLPRGGMQLQAVEGIVEQRYGAAWRLQLTRPLTLPASARPDAAPQVAGSLKVAAFNLENYFNGDGAGGGFPTLRGATDAAQLAAQQAKLVASINGLGADVAALMELENDGYGPASSIAQLVDALNADAQGPGDWRFVDAGQGPGSNPIRVGIIYRAGVLTPVGKPAVLEDGPFVEHSRVPLTQAFRRGNGPAFTVTAIHLKSKGCRDVAGADADQGDGQGCWNATRTDSAQRIVRWLGSDPTGSGSPHAVVLGDFNAYAMEQPLRALDAAGWRDAFAIAGVDQPYSYVYNGQLGRLDHALLSPSLAGLLRGAAEWHINADEPETHGYARDNQAGPWRSSDHDPLLLGLDL